MQSENSCENVLKSLCEVSFVLAFNYSGFFQDLESAALSRNLIF
jgi:hypothetical protein